jgi:hypothetical protein
MLCAGIPWQKNSFRDPFESVDDYNEFHNLKLLSRAIICPTPEMALLVLQRLVLKLQTWEEDAAATWFQTYWCGPPRTWTIGDAGVGHAAHNNGAESNLPSIISAVCDQQEN